MSRILGERSVRAVAQEVLRIEAQAESLCVSGRAGDRKSVV